MKTSSMYISKCIIIQDFERKVVKKKRANRGSTFCSESLLN